MLQVSRRMSIDCDGQPTHTSVQVRHVRHRDIDYEDLTVVDHIVTDLIRGDIYYWGELMAGALIAGLPVAILFNMFLDDFVAAADTEDSKTPA